MRAIHKVVFAAFRWLVMFIWLSLFSPLLAIPPTTDLIAWYKADDGGATGAVSSWVDQSGAGQHATQGTADNRPTRVANVVNGLPVIRFDGSNDALNLPNIFSSATEGEIIAVLKVGNATPVNAKNLWGFGKSGGTTLYALYPTTGSQMAEAFGRDAVLTVGTPAQDVEQFHIYDVVTSSSGWAILVNGLKHYSRFSNTVSFPTAPVIGRTSNGFDGDIAEVLIYSKVLSDADRTLVGKYLADKYALFDAAASTPKNISGLALSGTQISVTWNSPVLSNVIYYVLERKQGAGSFTQIANLPATMNYIDTSLAANTTYTYRVKATGYRSDSSYSDEISVTTLNSGTTDMPLNPKVWLRADAAVPLGPINTWNSAFNSNSMFQSNPDSKPVIVDNVINQRAVLRFDGSNDFVHFFDSPLASCTEADIFVILRAQENTPASDKRLWGFGYNGTSILETEYPSSDGKIIEAFAATTALTMGDPVDLTKFHMYHVLRKSSGNQIQSRINGMVFRNSWSISWNFPANYARIGAPSNSFAGDIAEVIIFGHSLSEEERRVVGSYLNQRYKLIESLPEVPVWAPPKAISSTQISLNWMAPLQSSAVFYTLERKTGGGGFSTIATLNSNLSHLDTGLSPSTTYTYRIKTQNVVGEAAYSGDISETTLASGAADFPIPSISWHKADGGNAPGPVNYWKRYLSDSGGTQTVGTRQPVLRENVVNERPALYFDGNDDALFFGNIFNGAVAGEAVIYLKAVDPAPAGNRYLWGFGRLGSSTIYSSYPDTSGRIQDAFGRSSRFNSNTPPIAIDNFHIYDVLSASSNWQNRFNGILDGSTGSNAVSFSTSCVIGSELGSFKGYVCELLLYNSLLSSAERTVVYNYLNSKYGVLDSDSDGLSDSWELRYFGDLAASGTGDSDNDGLTNLEEFQLSNPETATYPNPSNSDTDGDGLRDWREYALGTSIGNSDTDGDGMPDGYEVQFDLNVLYDDASGDIDADGQTNLQEFQAFSSSGYALNPDEGDANGDGVDDAVAYRLGLGLTDDPDGDGLTNLQERSLGTDGYRSDTDGDGHDDDVDDYPLDATRWTRLASNPFDLFSPIIVLDEPSTGVILP